MKLLKWNFVSVVFAIVAAVGPAHAQLFNTQPIDFANHPIDENFNRMQDKVVAAAHRVIPAIKTPIGNQEFAPEINTNVVNHAERAARIKELRKRLSDFSARASHMQVDVTGCRLVKDDTKASCYGLHDGFSGGPIERGMRFNENDMSVAFPDRKYLNAILVVKNMDNDVAKRVVVTDIGPSKSMQAIGRGVDLSVGTMKALGVKCPSIIKHVQIYNCAVRDHGLQNTQSAEYDDTNAQSWGGGGHARAAH